MLSFITNQTKHYKSQTAKLKVEIRLLRQLDPAKKAMDEAIHRATLLTLMVIRLGTRQETAYRKIVEKRGDGVIMLFKR